MTKLTDAKFHNEDAARAHLEALRWPDGPYCPHCGNSEPTTIRRLEGKSHRPGLQSVQRVSRALHRHRWHGDGAVAHPVGEMGSLAST